MDSQAAICYSGRYNKNLTLIAMRIVDDCNTTKAIKVQGVLS